MLFRDFRALDMRKQKAFAKKGKREKAESHLGA